MKKSYIVLLLCFMCVCTSLMSCGKNTDTKTEVEIETGVYIGNSGGEHEYEINPNAARHAYNLDFL